MNPRGVRTGEDTQLVVALMIGRAGSTGFPGKNIMPVLGRPLAAYPLMAARASRYVTGCTSRLILPRS